MRLRILTASAAAFLVTVFWLGVALSPSDVPSVAVIGDRADDLRAALAADPTQDATVTFVLLDRWESLRHLPDIAELCWDACHNRVAAQIALTQMRFGATRKVVVFHLPSFEGDMACIANRARHEVQALRPAAPACRTSAARVQVFILPLGLGRLP